MQAYKKFLASFSPNKKKPLPKESKHPVYVNVYDLATMNQVSTSMGFGIYHTGVEVFETEYSYGGHALDDTGIFESDPRDVQLLGWNAAFRETILVGHTDFDFDDVDHIVKELGQQFSGTAYHLLSRNCNHFADEFVFILCGRRLPNWINRLANVSCRIPFLQSVLPRKMLVPISGEDDELSDTHSVTEYENIDGNDNLRSFKADQVNHHSSASSNSQSSSGEDLTVTHQSSNPSTGSIKSSMSSPVLSRNDVGRHSLKDRLSKLGRPNRPFANLKR